MRPPVAVVCVVAVVLFVGGETNLENYRSAKKGVEPIKINDDLRNGAR
jgi:hypothetical protein